MSIKNPSVKFIIFVLMICTFSIGYTEYAVMGILTSIANDFANALGAWIGGMILSGTGSYSWLFAGGALMTACGLVLSTLAHLSEKKSVYEYQVNKG